MKQHGKELDKDQKKHLRTKFVKGWELVPNTARLCIMNLYLHGIDADPCPIKSGVDSLAGDPGERFSVVLTNPPLVKKSSIAIVNEEAHWLAYDCYELMKRDKVNLDIFWLKDSSLEDSDDLPTPNILAQEIADDLLTAFEQFTAITEKVAG